MRLRPCGDAALLVELGDLAQVRRLTAALQARRAAMPPPTVTDVVPAARTVLVRFDPTRTSEEAVVAWVRAPASARPGSNRPTGQHTDAALVELPVVYDGADLDEVGRLTGLGRDGVVAAHTAARWSVAFCGFAPGFAYCAAESLDLDVPRRVQPRSRVPAGSVGLAGEFTGVYPRASPGGWQLVGRTDATLWDLDRDPPALLAPGTAVRFVSVA